MRQKMYLGADPILFEFAKQLRQIETPSERLLWERLCRNQLGVRFRRQHPIYQFIADFYCHPNKLIVELDGAIHNTTINQEYDKMRSIVLVERGITVIRFTNDQVQNEIEKVLEEIKKYLT